MVIQLFLLINSMFIIPALKYTFFTFINITYYDSDVVKLVVFVIFTFRLSANSFVVSAIKKEYDFLVPFLFTSIICHKKLKMSVKIF